MDLSTPEKIRNSIVDEVNQIAGISGGETTLPESTINDLVRALMDIPEDNRALQMQETVNDIVQRRLGDPRHDDPNYP